MLITNKYSLPQPIVDAIKNDPYTRGESDMSVTQLVDSPRAVGLKRLHFDEIVVDASQLLMPLLGQSTHVVLERSGSSGTAERRLSILVEGWRISGGVDFVCKDGVLTDYKVTNITKLKDGKAPFEFEAQVNCYAEILRENGETVSALQICGILRDWRKSELMREKVYPPAPMMTVSVPLWSREQAQKYMRERVILHKQARISLPECSPEERWERPSKWALMKRGGKRSIKNYDSKSDADAHASTDPKNLYVEARPGLSVRCENYCDAAPFCSQFKQANQQPASQANEEEKAG